MAVIIHSFSLNILPKMSCGVLECDIVVTELHAYDFVIKRGIIYAGPCISSVYCIVCPPPQINLIPSPFIPSLPYSTPLSPFPSGNHHIVVCVYELLLFF